MNHFGEFIDEDQNSIMSIIYLLLHKLLLVKFRFTPFLNPDMNSNCN